MRLNVCFIFLPRVNKDRAEGKHLAVKRSDGWIPVIKAQSQELFERIHKAEPIIFQSQLLT